MGLVKWKCDVPNGTPQGYYYSKQYESIFFSPHFSISILNIFLKSNLVFVMFIKILPKILEKNGLFGNETNLEFNTLIAFSSTLFGKILKPLVVF
jgi:hypothetical protein